MSKSLSVAGTHTDANGQKQSKTINTDVNGNIGAQLFGRNVETLTPIDKLAIRDTAVTSITIDLSKYKEVHFYAISTLDKAPDLQIRPFSSTMFYFNGMEWVENRLAISQRYLLMDIGSALPHLSGKAFGSIMFRVSANVAPTTGEFTLYVVGVPN